MEASHKPNVFVGITGKGPKDRKVPFALDLMRDLLEVGIWTVRRQQLAMWGTGESRQKQDGWIFLSFSTKRHLSAGAVGDLMKAAFKACGVRGSGQRLRAHYATMMAARLLDHNMALNNFQYQRERQDYHICSVG